LTTSKSAPMPAETDGRKWKEETTRAAGEGVLGLSFRNRESATVVVNEKRV